MKKYRGGALIGIVFLFFILSGCLSDKTSTTEGKSDLTAVKVMLMPYLSFAPLFIAQEEGYFEENGIEVEFIKFGSPVQAMPALIQGDLDVATGGITSSLFNAISRGSNLKIVADKGQLHSRCSNAAILVNKELFESGEISEIAHLEGKKLALEDFGGWGFVYSQILSMGNLELEDIESTLMSPPNRIAALSSKAVVGVQLGEPLITKLTEDGMAVKLVGYEEVVPELQIAYLVFGPNLLDEDPELGKRFMVAYLKGVRQFNEGKTERNIEIIQNYTHLDGDLINRACWIYINPNGYPNTNSLLIIQKWGYDNGYVDDLVSEDQLFDMSFADYAKDVLS